MPDISHLYLLDKSEQLAKSAIKAPGGGKEQPTIDTSIAVGRVAHVDGDQTLPLHMIDRAYVTRRFSIITAVDGRGTTTPGDTGPIQGMLLPWASNEIWGIKIEARDRFEFCFTDAMDGCCVVVQGCNMNRPTFFHANFGVDPVFAPKASPAQMNDAMRKTREARTSCYDTLIPLLKQQMAPTERDSTIQTAFRPEYYMDPDKFPGFKGASVFGFKYGDNWVFHYHVVMELRGDKSKLPKEAFQLSANIYSATGECWPNFQTLTWG